MQENTRPSPPNLTVGQLRAAGIRLPGDLADELAASLLQLTGAEGPEYWAGLHNFYVITRYNHSNLYAMAVFQLSGELLAQHDAATKTAQAGD